MLSDGMLAPNGEISSVLEVHVYSCELSQTRGEICESGEMAPAWFRREEVPLPQMWADDEFWLPHVLQDKDVLGNFVFADKDTIVQQQVDVFEPGRLQVDEIE